MATDPQFNDMREAELRALTAIRRMAHALDRHSKSAERAAGLTLPQFVVLAAVRAQGEVTSAKLSAAVSLSPATVTLVLDNLAARGLVERYRNLEDRRVVHARLTPQGAEVLARTPRYMSPRFAARLDALAPERREAILAALEEVAGLMDAAEPG